MFYPQILCKMYNVAKYVGTKSFCGGQARAPGMQACTVGPYQYDLGRILLLSVLTVLDHIP